MLVSDSVEVKIFAQDNHGVEQVLLTIDTLETTLTDSPYVYIWGTNEYPNGTSIIIGAIAFDSSSNQSTAQSISVTVDNEYYETITDLAVIQGTGALTLNWDIPMEQRVIKYIRMDLMNFLHNRLKTHTLIPWLFRVLYMLPNRSCECPSNRRSSFRI